MTRPRTPPVGPREIAVLRERLAVAEQTLDAIRRGEVDAVVVSGPRGDQLFTLKGADEPYRVLVEQISEGALTLNADGVILYANRALGRLVGRPLGNVIGTPLADLVGDGERQALVQLLRAALATGQESCEIALHRAAGEEVVLRLGASRLPPESEAAFCVVATDVTEAHRRRVQLQDSRDELEERVRARTAEIVGHTRRLEELQQVVERRNDELEIANRELEAFAYSVSHDLRTPLRALDGFSFVLLQDYSDKLDAEGHDALQRIRAASQRMGRLIDDLLRLSRVTRAELHVTQMDLTAAAREIASSLQEAEPGRVVRWEIDEGMQARGDPALVKIALHNLAANAWKFSSRTAQPVIRIGARANGHAATYFVADNGVGFDMAHADQIFGAFQRLHAEADFPGTGIGLAIVQRIVKRHGGSIRVESKPGEGATFAFTLEPPAPARARAA